LETLERLANGVRQGPRPRVEVASRAFVLLTTEAIYRPRRPCSDDQITVRMPRIAV
jgi:hypothetical protein